MAHKIIHGWWTECSECGGNARRDELAHVHGGLDRGPAYNKPESTLEKTNGCGAIFHEPDVHLYVRRN